ncbi:hypothetical protein ACGFU4_31250 [Streptomyces sp. NPDC048511]|uniref:hypothetical protein n=1 Tax=Streptomyces sp. NPDC048511 TaxID=3365562 RepID=UPI00371F9E39
MRKMVSAAAVAIALGGTLLTASPASATNTCTTVQIAVGGKLHLGGTACFQSNGDIFSIKDEYADGYHTEVWWEAGTERSICRNLGGAGTTVTCKHDLPEGGKVRFGAYVVKGSTVMSAGPEKVVSI